MNSVFRTSLLAAFSCAAVASFGSFDLMLLPGSDGRVYRYDPVNRVNLGSYLTGSSNMTIAADTDGVAYSGSASGSSYLAHRYATGETAGQFIINTALRSLIVRNGNLFSLNSTGVLRKLNPLNGGTVQSTTLSALVTWRTMAMLGNNLIAIGTNNTSNQVSFLNISATDLSMGSALTSSTTANAASFGKADSVVNGISGIKAVAFTCLIASGLQVYQLQMGSSDTVVSTAITSFAIGGTGGFNNASDMPAIVASHSGMYVYGQDATTPSTLARLTRLDFYGSALNVSHSTTFTAPGGSWSTGHPGWHPANVVAPEPGTLLGCGVGLAAMLRRRRTRR